MTGPAILSVVSAGPLVSIQDGGRPGLMRYGVPASGPMDRGAARAANLALGNPPDAPCIEISMAGLQIACRSGGISFAVTGGGFIVDHAGRARASWMVASLSAGQTLYIRPGHWGSWCYLALAGDLQVSTWLGSAATYAIAGLGAGALRKDQQLTVARPEVRTDRHRDLACPVWARPRSALRVTLGPQDRFFTTAAITRFRTGIWRMTSAWDRMGVRLAGDELMPSGRLDMPSEPILRGSIQVSGDGAATVLLADHQTTGGYPRIATALDCDLDAFVQLRPGDPVMFRTVAPQQAIEIARTAALVRMRYLGGLLK